MTGSFDSWGEVKAAYRLLDAEQTTHAAVCESHFGVVTEQLCSKGVHVVIEDTTTVAFNTRHGASDLGPIGEDFTRGFWLHTTLALRIDGPLQDDGCLPAEMLGMLDQQAWVRTKSRKGESRRKRLKRQRESHRWANCVAGVDLPSCSQCIFVADREADICEVFERCESAKMSFVIRAGQPRALVDQAANLFDRVAKTAVRDRRSVNIPAKGGRAARKAKVELRTSEVTFRGPYRPGGHLPHKTVNVIEVRERPTKSVKTPLHWVLLTDMDVSDVNKAWWLVAVYKLRWLIEEFHKVLKTGLKLESSQLSDGRRLQALAGILSVVATRLLNMKLRARYQPDEPVAHTDVDPIAMLLLERKYRRPKHGRWTYGHLFRCIARLGGHLGRNSDGPPGWLTIWRGWRRLADQAIGYDLGAPRCG